MKVKQTCLIWLTVSCIQFTGLNAVAQNPIRISSPMSPPTWALLEREVLDIHAENLWYIGIVAPFPWADALTVDADLVNIPGHGVIYNVNMSPHFSTWYLPAE